MWLEKTIKISRSAMGCRSAKLALIEYKSYMK